MKRLLILLVLLVSVPLFAHAQSQTSAPDLVINSVPLNPSPLSSVTFTLQSFSINLDQATITWRYNDRIFDGGVGKKRVTVVSPGSGSVGTITASVSIPGTTTTTAAITLRPASVDVLWEGADSYVPAFYKGKALTSVNSIVRVVAVPSFTAPKNLSYSWTLNDQPALTASGYGKSAFLFKNSELTNLDSVLVTASSGGFSGSGVVNIIPRNPSVIGYAKNDGFIDYSTGSTSNIATVDNGLVLRLEPYYFSVGDTVSKNLSFSVTSGDEAVPLGDTPNELLLARPDGGGSRNFTVNISTIAYTLQHIKHLFTVSFR